MSENIIGKLIIKYKKREGYYIESCVYIVYVYHFLCNSRVIHISYNFLHIIL